MRQDPRNKRIVIDIIKHTLVNFVTLLMTELLFRSQPRKVCTLLANGVAIFCDRNCQHGDYDTRGDPVERDEENILM